MEHHQLGSRPRRECLKAVASLALAATARAQGRPEYRDLVVVVPGIMGSMLSRDGTLIWGLDLTTLVRSLVQSGLSLSALREPPTGGTGSKVQATGLIETATLIPGFWSLDGYTELRQALMRDFGLTLNRNYREFAYDWRQDNRVSAGRLLQASEQWLGEWREASKSPRAKVVFVCHSMGGLVVRYACEVLNLRQQTRAVFTVGTPYQGSYKALDRLVSGFVSEGLTKTLAEFDSVYQLLPLYPCIELEGQRRTLQETGSRLDGRIDMARWREVGLGFARACNEAASKRRSEPVNMSWNVVQGYTHETPTIGRWTSQGLRTIQLNRSDPLSVGDGTVPAYRYARPEISSVPTGEMFCNQLHGTIQASQAVHVHVSGVMGSIAQLEETALPPSTSRDGGARVSLRFRELVRPDEDLEMRIGFENVVPANTEVQVHAASDGRQVARVELFSQNGLQQDFAPSVRLTERGAYRVSVRGAGTVLCRDLLCVL